MKRSKCEFCGKVFGFPEGAEVAICPHCDGISRFIAPPVVASPKSARRSPPKSWLFLVAGIIASLVTSIMIWGDYLRDTILGTCLILFCGVVYFAPTIVANQRHHRNAEAIAVLNFLGGWTFIGWLVALVWAVTKPRV